MYLQTKTRGFTLIETLFYTIGLVVLLATMTTFMYYMYDWYQRVTVTPRIDRIGISMLEKVSKDIRTGKVINAAQSVFGANNGSLSFNAPVNSVLVTKYFSLNTNRLAYQENGGPVAYVSPAGVNISRFYIISTTTPVSQGVKFDFDITYTLRSGSVTKTYSDFVILKQSYE